MEEAEQRRQAELDAREKELQLKLLAQVWAVRATQNGRRDSLD